MKSPITQFPSAPYYLYCLLINNVLVTILLSISYNIWRAEQVLRLYKESKETWLRVFQANRMGRLE
jgi:hypothetical protein